MDSLFTQTNPITIKCSLYMPSKHIRKYSSYIILLQLMQLYGCTQLGEPQINDVRYVSTSLVSFQDHPEIEWIGERPSWKMLRIEFESDADILMFAQKNQFNVVNSIFFCKDGKDLYKSGIDRFSDVFTSDARLDPYTKKPSTRGESKDRRFKFFIYARTATDSWINADNQTIPGYDLSKTSTDLCAYVRGGNMIGGHFFTNIIKVPATEIAYALRQ